MGLFSKILKPKKPQKTDAPFRYVEKRSSPRIKGHADFGGNICGFDLSNECYSDGGVIKLTGANWRKAMDDFISLEGFFNQVSDYDKTFPQMLRVSIYDEAAPSAKLNGLTPSGKKPKYAMIVSFDAAEPTKEPDDWDAWIDAYASADNKTREKLSQEVLPHPYSGDNIVGAIHYLQTGAIGKADFHFWNNHVCHSVHIRSKGSALYLSKATRKDAQTDETVTTYQA